MKPLKSIRNFFYSIYVELKKVDWLNKKETYQYTLIVIFFLIIGTLYILGIDELLTELRSVLIFQSI